MLPIVLQGTGTECRLWHWRCAPRWGRMAALEARLCLQGAQSLARETSVDSMLPAHHTRGMMRSIGLAEGTTNSGPGDSGEAGTPGRTGPCRGAAVSVTP